MQHGIATLMRRALKLNGRTQAQIAVVIGFSEAAVSRWLSGDRSPSVKALTAFVGACGLTMEEFYALGGKRAA